MALKKFISKSLVTIGLLGMLSGLGYACKNHIEGYSRLNENEISWADSYHLPEGELKDFSDNKLYHSAVGMGVGILSYGIFGAGLNLMPGKRRKD